MMYAATSGDCAGAPNAVYAIDLDAPDKPVVSYHTSGGSIVGSVAFSSDGKTLLAAIGPGTAKGDGKANAIVALDPITLRLKDWFTQPTAEFVTGPTVFRHGTKDVVAAATKDGRVILLDAASLGGTKHDTPLLTSSALFESGGSIAAKALATWARPVGATATGARTEARSLSGSNLRQTVRRSLDQRANPQWRSRRSSRRGDQRQAIAGTGMDVQRFARAGDTDHCQRSRVRVVHRTGAGSRPELIGGGALRL